MPNHVKNVIKFKNLKPKDIDIILDMIATQDTHAPVKDKEYSIDFDKIIPEPRTIEECPADCVVTDCSHIEEDKERPWFDWYKWHLTYWGTKWGAYDSYAKIGKSYIIFVFSTPWNMPLPVISRLSLLGYEMEVKYADEDIGYNCGKMTYTTYTLDHGWTYWDETKLKDPARFARNLWNHY